jgi:hypothetical protein
MGERSLNSKDESQSNCILIELKSNPTGWTDIQFDRFEARNRISLDASLRSA